MKPKFPSVLLPILALAISTLIVAPAALAQSPLPDSFNPGTAGGFNDYVTTIGLQTDGSILVGGRFTALGGQTRANIGRLHGDGMLDTRFDPGAGGGLVEVDSLAVQSDGRIVVGGGFENLGGLSRIHIGRLNSDGTLDMAFNPGADDGYSPRVSALALQADEKILVGGEFRVLGGQSRYFIGRLNLDGTPDPSFDPGAGPWHFYTSVSSFAFQPDGSILVGGHFTTLGSQSRANIARLNPDGTLDTAFNPGATNPYNPNADPTEDGNVASFALQPDGKILVGGNFTTLSGQSRTNIGRLNADGSIDSSFDSRVDGHVSSLALQADGKILVGGLFDTLGGQSRTNIGRLNSDGTLDTGFDPGVDGPVYSLALQADGKILAGGYFTMLGGQNRARIGRLNNTGPATQSLSFNASTLTWMRGGTSPEVGRTTFEYSSDGTLWHDLGAGARIPGGWQLVGLGLPTNTTFRARGYMTGGNGSSWLVESVIGPPVINSQPPSLTNNATTTAAFRVEAVGSQTLSYQWRKDGEALADGSNVSGAATATLTLTYVLRSDMGRYSVVISNSLGSVTSAIVLLTVIDPVINSEPAGLTNNADTAAAFHVDASGDASLSYRWRKDGENLTNSGNVSGAATPQLTLANTLHSDAGGYSVIVTDAAGSVTSVVATLTVIDPAITDQSFDQMKSAGESVTLSVEAAGTPPLSYQWWKNGLAQPGATQSSLTLTNLQGSDAGSYEVVVSNAWGSATSTAARLTVYLHTLHYVDLNSASPVPPYTNWTTAATTIQDAVDAAVAGDQILVTNGIYQSGGRVTDDAISNRVVVTKPLTLRSVNGPDVTIVDGGGATRCIYLGDRGAALAGFTLTKGAGGGGGGVCCASENITVSNCIIAANSAYSGGGAYGGTLDNCTLSTNAATEGPGGGAYNCTLNNCTLKGNSALKPGGMAPSPGRGGGAYQGTLSNCVLSDNSAVVGGGATDSTLNNCTLTGNSAVEGGGAGASTLNNCTLTGNSADWGGGGAILSTLNNCTLSSNSAGGGGGGGGGGATDSTLNNCTLIGNSAFNGGGGAFYSTLNNCIVYFNTADQEANYDSSSTLNYCCTMPLHADGLGNISADPQLASASHLSALSPCIAKGNFAAVTGVDIDGEPWANPPSMGCDEYHAGAIMGPLSESITASLTNVAVGYPVGFTGLIDGRTDLSVWEFGDGSVKINQPYTTHVWTAPGVYLVALWSFNESHPGGVSATLVIHVEQALYYVAARSASPAAPYTSWATAATNIQDAVDVAIFGGTILVTNGTYSAGGRAVQGTLTNRVAVDKPLRLLSINGPEVTLIQGYQVLGTTNGDGAVRCVFLAGGATLSGFTLTNGATRSSGDSDQEVSGGGVWCSTTSALVSNCVVSGNSAGGGGGGASRGTLNNCTLTGNSAGGGGGAYYSTLNNCTLTGNSAFNGGGGASDSTLNNCVLTGNSAVEGGGAYQGKLNNCVLSFNSAGYTGGGADSADLNNCTLTANSASAEGGGAIYGTLNNCIVYFNTATQGSNNGYAGIRNYCCTTPQPANGIGNFTNTPLFVNQVGGNLHLQSNSPCINAGANVYAVSATDLDGRPRIVGGTVDIGAYEFQGVGSRISYAWLQQYGLPTDGSADYTDPDHDGLNNWQEWIAGTDPTNPSSMLKMLPPASLTNAPGVAVSWQSVAGVSYFLERTMNLSAPVLFAPVATSIPGQPGTTAYTDASAIGPGPFFYRVGVSSP